MTSSRIGIRRKFPSISILRPENFVFTTHLLPVDRGILSTLYVWLGPARKADEIEALYRKFYAGRPMVRVMPAGHSAGVAARDAHEFLRYRFRARSFGRASGGRFVPRQSRQRCGGAGGTKSQWDARVSRNGGFAMRMVIKIAGALLERDEDVQTTRASDHGARARRPRDCSSFTAAAGFSPRRSRAWESPAASSMACASPIAKRATRP